MGKAGLDKRKCEDNQIESILDDQRLVTHEQVRDLFLLVGQLVENTNPQKEDQEQGRQGDRDRGSFKERDNYRRGNSKVVGTTNNKVVETMENNGNMQTLQLLLDRNMGRLGKSGQKTDKRGSSDEICGEDTPHYKHLASASNIILLTCSQIWSGSMSRKCSLMEARCPFLRSRNQMQVTTINHQINLKNTRQRRSTRQWSRLSKSRVLQIMRLRRPATPSNKSKKTLRGNESQVSSYISKIVGQSTGKSWTPESGTLIMVNSRVERRLKKMAPPQPIY